MRRPFQGVQNIIRFNWHFYLLSAIASGTFSLLAGFTTGTFYFLSVAVVAVITLTTILSLLASFYIYDLSDLYELQWVKEYSGNQSRIVNIHSGFDETSCLIKQYIPGAELIVMDFYDEKVHAEISIKRAREAYPSYPGTQRIKTSSVPLPDDYADVVVIMLSAHEIRSDEERVVFFRELKRVVRGEGKIIVTEHLRDTANFLIYTIGFLHFFSRSVWQDTFQLSGLTILHRAHTTPFITTFILQKNGIAS